MSIEDLKEQNILLPEEEWGKHSLDTPIAQVPVLILFLFAVASCIIAFLGNGNTWTWIGTIVFFLSFFGIVILSDRGIQKQRERFKKEKREFQNQKNSKDL